MGQEIKTGEIIAQIDSREAQKNVRDAQTDLGTAKLELSKLLEPLTELEILQDQSAVDLVQRNLDELINPTADAVITAQNTLIDA